MVGLIVADAKAGLALVGDEFACEVDGEGTEWWSAPDAPAALVSTGAHLIPMYDELTIAYRQARVVFAEQPPRSGLLERPILVDGTTIGSWKRIHGAHGHRRGDAVHGAGRCRACRASRTKWHASGASWAARPSC